MTVYAIIDSGKVSNVIVADETFVNLIALEHEAVVLQVGSCGIGNNYHNNVFISQPQNLSVLVGEIASFSVVGNSAEGTLTYQWKKNGTNIETATDLFYTIESTISEDAGNYSCVVSNGSNSVESDVAILEVRE